MKYKLIGTDFDGTLLTDDKRVSDENIEYLRKAKDLGIKIVAVTGRTIESVKNVIKLDIFDYIVLNNGATIYDIMTKKIIYANVIDSETIDRIVSEVKDNSYQIDFCTFEKYYIIGGNPPKDIPFIVSIDNYKKITDGISKINIFLKKNINIKEIEKKLSKLVKNVKVIIMQDSDSDKQWIVITPNNTSKKTAMEELGRITNIELEEMVMFGDGLNDVEVIEAVGNGVAMSNALEEVKKKAKNQTKSNNDSGVAYYIKNYIINE